MRLVTFPVAGGGGSSVLINPEHVVCVIDMGEHRSQIVTTGLSGQSAMSLLVEEASDVVGARLQLPG